jgi:FHS family Na+ dependent glucose MFS transporter 1
MPATRNRRLARTSGYYAAFVALGLVTAALGPTLPGLAEHTQAQLGEISFLFTAHSLGYLLGSLLGGWLYDRVPGHPVMAAALAVLALMLGIIPVVPLLPLLTVALLFLGMGGGALDVGGNTLLVWVYGRQVGPFMNALHFFFGVGSFLAPIVVAQTILRTGDITWAYWVMALCVLPVAAWLFALSSPTSRASSSNRSGSPLPTTGLDSESERRERLLVALIALLLSLYVGAEAGFGGWIYTYALALDLGTTTTSAYLTSAFWGAFTLGRLLSIPLAARFRPRSILLGDLVGCLACVGLLLVWPHSRAATWLGTLGLGFAMASIFPTAVSLAERHMTLTGQRTGWFLIGASVGGMSLPWLIGQLFEAIGPQMAMLAIMGDLALALGVYLAFILPATR